MGSAHYLIEMNISSKLEIHSDVEEMEWTHNSRVNPMALNCNLNLESA